MPPSRRTTSSSSARADGPAHDRSAARYHVDVGRAAKLRLGLALVTGAGCRVGAFVCEHDEQCVGPEGIGFCEADGACSFPDDSCASGRRYGDHAPAGRGGRCVEPVDGSTGVADTGVSTSAVGGSSSHGDVTTTAGVDDAASTTGVRTGDVGVACPPAWMLCAMHRRMRLVATPSAGAMLSESAVTIPVVLTLDRFDPTTAQPAGEDLRVVDAQGEALPHEIERWSPEEGALLWVRVPELPPDGTTAWLYWGDATAADAQDPATVWADHAGVWHLDAALDDATQGGHLGVASGEVAPAAGMLGEAQAFTGADGRITIAGDETLDNLCFGGCTLSAWIAATSWGGTLRGRIADKSGGGNGGWMFYVDGNSGGELRFRHGFAMAQQIWSTPPMSLTLEQWHHVAATYDALGDAPPRLYIDGVEQAVALDSGSPLGGPVMDDGVELLIGDSDVPSRWFDGRIDELRVEHVVRMPSWIALQAQAGADALLEYGAVEAWP